MFLYQNLARDRLAIPPTDQLIEIRHFLEEKKIDEDKMIFWKFEQSDANKMKMKHGLLQKPTEQHEKLHPKFSHPSKLD